jgi:putative transcriptional regulator
MFLLLRYSNKLIEVFITIVNTCANLVKISSFEKPINKQPFTCSTILNRFGSIYYIAFQFNYMNLISQILKNKGLPQQFLVEKLGVTRSTVSQWCTNTIQPPLQRLYEVSDALGCDVTELLVSSKNKIISNETDK